jgi:hypothetical protein
MQGNIKHALRLGTLFTIWLQVVTKDAEAYAVTIFNPLPSTGGCVRLM